MKLVGGVCRCGKVDVKNWRTYSVITEFGFRGFRYENRYREGTCSCGDLIREPVTVPYEPPSWVKEA